MAVLGTTLGTRLGIRLGSGHALITPSSILGAAYHSDWRADDANRVMVGGNVAGLYNYGLDASDALQANVLLQPTYGATAVHGGPGIVSGGAKGLVATLNTPITNGARPYYFLVASAANTAQWAYLVHAGNPSDTALIIQTTTWESRLSGTGTTGGTSDTNLHLFEWSFDGTNKLIIDGVAVIVGAQTSPGVMSHGLLCDYNSDVGSAATLVRLIVAVNPTPTQVSAMRAYLRGANFPNYTSSSYGLP